MIGIAKPPLAAAPNGGLNQDAALWLGCLDRIIACAEGIAETARINPTRMLRDWPPAYWLEAFRPLAPSCALSGLGHVVEARMLTRSIFENEFYLYRLAQDGSPLSTK